MQPSSRIELPDTLALRIQFLRDQLDLTPRALADKALAPIELIQDLEAGLETFLAPSVRQKIARVLRVRPSVLLEVEKRPATDPLPAPLDGEARLDLLQAILDRPDRHYFCPACGADLMVRIFERRNLYDQPVTAIKASCTKCLFLAEHG